MQIEWRVLPSGTAITNGVIAGRSTSARWAPGRFVGYARGIDWKMIAP